jgi:tight adherence protein B
MDPIIPLASVLLGLGVLGVVLYGTPWLKAGLARREARYVRTLDELFLFSVSPRSLSWAALGSGILLGLLLAFAARRPWTGLIGLWLGTYVPGWVLRLMVRRRRARLEAQLVDGILALSNSVRAGLTLVDALRLVEENAPQPTSQEFGLILREYEHGLALEQALDNAALRIPNPSYKLVFAALKTSRERGGNVGDTLDRISESVREIHRLEERVKTLTAQGRLAARIMMLMPVFIAAILYLIDPQGIMLLFTDPVGHILLMFIVLLNVLGFLWIRKIVSIDV